MTYELVPYSNIKPFIPIMEKLGVSTIARSNKGFLTYYKDNHKLNEFWEKKRNSFIVRTLAAYNIKPTYRRWLSLLAWAYYVTPSFEVI
jgi:uncharacterized membrane protein YkvA (DUF1232 family)